jgi:hypothetical protein
MTPIPETQAPRSPALQTPPDTVPSASRLPAPVPPTVTSRRYRLPAGTAGVIQARARVRAAVRDWDLPVSEGMAALLTWHLVMSVTPDVSSEGPGGADGTEGPAGPVGPRGAASADDPPGQLTLGVSCSRGTLRVDVYDERRSLPARGYEIVASMADDWGIYRTPAGRAVYFSLAFAALPRGSAPAPQAPR